MFGKLTKKGVVRLLLVFLAGLGILIAIAQISAKNAVAHFFNRKLPTHVQLKYADITANVLRGNVSLKDISLDFYNRDSMVLNTKVNIDILSLEGIGYWDFLFNQKIAVDRLHLNHPVIQYYPYKISSQDAEEPEGVVQLLKSIAISKLSVHRGNLNLFRDNSDSTALVLKNINFNIAQVSTDPHQITEKIPVTYEDYEMSADSLYVNLGSFEKLDVATLLWNRKGAEITGLQLQSKYDKLALSKHLFEERDHIDLVVPMMRLDSIRFGFQKDTFYIETGKGVIEEPALELFRDKLVADGNDTKKFYSRNIRELPIYLNVPQIEINNGTIVYSERVADISDPGKLSFDMLNANIRNISNTYPKGETTVISAKTKFMGSADMNLDWSFDFHRTNDAFYASGSVFNFDTESINPFLRSNARAKASGLIDELYFTVDGDAWSSSGTMKMKYKNFRFQVLKKNRMGINKILTTIGNLFINDGSKANAAGYRFGRIETKRDSKKSFFNYLWLSVRDGTLSTLTGNGQKK